MSALAEPATIPYRVDEWYDGVIKGVFRKETKVQHTPLLTFKIWNPACGFIWHDELLTPGRKEYVRRLLVERLGLPENLLKNPDFWDNPGNWLNEKPVRFLTETHVYQDKETVRIKVLTTGGSPRSQVSPQFSTIAASLFATADQSEYDEFFG